jgi:hypothetical protein
MLKLIIALSACSCSTIFAGIVETTNCTGIVYEGLQTPALVVTQDTNDGCGLGGNFASFSTEGGISGNGFSLSLEAIATTNVVEPFENPPIGTYVNGSVNGTYALDMALATGGPLRSGFVTISAMSSSLDYYSNGLLSDSMTLGPYSCAMNSFFPPGNSCSPPISGTYPVMLGSGTLFAVDMDATASAMSGEGVQFSSLLSVQFFEADGVTPASATLVDPNSTPEPGSLYLVGLGALCCAAWSARRERDAGRVARIRAHCD